MSAPPRASAADSRQRPIQVCGMNDPRTGGPVTHSLSSQKVDRRNPWVGLLARKVRIADVADSRPLHLPRLLAEWCSRSDAFTHSGGTAPDSHRTSLLCP